jgi:DNA-binding transcriptional ArsR family regulator
MDLDAQQMAARAPDAAAFLKLLANQNRLMILCALTEQELSVASSISACHCPSRHFPNTSPACAARGW